MEERILRGVAVLCSVSGLLLLFYVSTQIEQQSYINTITIDDVGKTVKVCGVISSKQVSKNHIFLNIKDQTGGIRFVVFNSTALRLKEQGTDVYLFSLGDRICALGAVDEYPKGSGELELIYRRGAIEEVI